MTSSSDVPDDWQLRLVALPPDAAFSRSGQSIAIDRATEILKNCGDQSRQASKSLEDSNEALRRMIRETYKWMVAPMQDARPGKGLSGIQWEHFQVNPGAPNLYQEIERVLKENELLITECAPIHLNMVLKDWL